MHMTAESACKMRVNGVRGCAYLLVLETFAWVGVRRAVFLPLLLNLNEQHFANEQKLKPFMQISEFNGPDVLSIRILIKEL